MFVYSVKASTVKFFGLLSLVCVVLLAVILSIPSEAVIPTGGFFSDDKAIHYDKIRTDEERKRFLSQFGWETDENLVEEVEIKIPNDFDKVMNSYNEIQKNQGLDLSKYKGKTVTRYTYKISNYSGYDGTVLANVIVYKNKVVGGDLCSSDIEGFIHGFANPGEALDTEKTE